MLSLTVSRRSCTAGWAAQAEKIGVVPLGYLPEERGFSLESRHLGLVTAEEIADLKERMKLLAGTMEETVDIEGILRAGERGGDI